MIIPMCELICPWSSETVSTACDGEPASVSDSAKAGTN
jgi:hypothetical protein